MKEQTTVMVDDKQYMRNARGDLVPVEKVKDVDILRNQTVRLIAEAAIDMSGRLGSFKEKVFGDADSFIALSFEKYGVKHGGKKGNVTLNTYDGEYKVSIDCQDVISFDERLQAAKELIDTCIHKWSTGANDNLKILVNDAFKVDKKGNVDTRRVLELRRYEIDDPDWNEAMDAISESITVLMSRRYMRVYRRADDGMGYQMIPLDFASI